MARADRLFRLLAAFRLLPQPVTAARLAEETGVSERTLYRDIEALRAGGRADRRRGGAGLHPDRRPRPAAADVHPAGGRGAGSGSGRSRACRATRCWPRPPPRRRPRSSPPCPTGCSARRSTAVSRSYRYERRSPAPPHLHLLREAAWDERAVDLTYRDVSRPDDRPAHLAAGHGLSGPRGDVPGLLLPASGFPPLQGPGDVRGPPDRRKLPSPARAPVAVVSGAVGQGVGRVDGFRNRPDHPSGCTI